MGKIISGYLWAWKNTERGKKSLETLRKFYPDSDMFINVDFEGDTKVYKQISEEIGATFSINNFQLGYCGNYNGVNVGRECWPKEFTFEWVRGIYEACKKTDSKYFMILEEDDFILKPISILDTNFSMAIHPTNPAPNGRYRPNFIPPLYKEFIIRNGGNPNSDGYAAGGGVIFNREQFIKSWESTKYIIWNNYDILETNSRIIGWADYILQFIMQLQGYEIIQNHKLCEHWEVDNWMDFEIVTGLKDLEAILKL